MQLTNCDSDNTEILTEGKSVKVLIDSCASVNCMDKKTFNPLKTKYSKLEKSNTNTYPFASKIQLELLGVSNLKRSSEWEIA